MKRITISNGETRIGYEVNDLVGEARESVIEEARATLESYEEDDNGDFDDDWVIDLEKLQSGDLVTLTHKDKEGIGYIYDNWDTENPHLIIGISWKDGGTSNTTVFESIADGVVFNKVSLL